LTEIIDYVQIESVGKNLGCGGLGMILPMQYGRDVELPGEELRVELILRKMKNM